MRKPAFCICENKAGDQLCGNSQPLAILCGCTARFVWDLVRNPKDRFSHNKAHIVRSAGPISTVGSMSRSGFGSLQVRFPGPAHSFTICQLLVKG